MTELTPTQTNSIKLAADTQTAAKLKTVSSAEAEIVVTGGEEIVFSSDQYINVRTSSEIDAYTGSYEFTPTQETQTVAIKSLYATDNITINPIPSNYGLITWNGAKLTVS